MDNKQTYFYTYFLKILFLSLINVIVIYMIKIIAFMDRLVIDLTLTEKRAVIRQRMTEVTPIET